MKSFYKKGINIIEFIIIFTILSAIFAIVLPELSKSRENQVVKSAVQEMLSSIDKARSQTLSSLNSSEYGVHFQSDKVIIFKGKVFSALDSNNENIEIVSPAFISTVSLTAGAGDLYFSRLSGVPSATGTVVVSSPNLSKTITISATGVASPN